MRDVDAKLASIADLLGVPVDAFRDEGAPSDLARRAELMRLWDAMPDDAGRDRLLSLARDMVGHSAAAPPKLAAE